MSDSNNKPKREEVVATALIKGNGGKCEVIVSCRPDLPEILGISKEEVLAGIGRDAVQHILKEQVQEKASEAGHSTVGYSKSYYDRWDAIFGSKKSDETLN